MFDLLWTFIVSRLFWIRPKFKREADVLVAKSGWRTHLYTLGSYSRAVFVDPRQKAVRVCMRRFWLFVKWRRFPFDAVRGVTYNYTDISPGAGWSVAHESGDLFTVGLLLVDNKEFVLFRFYGPGGFVNESYLPDWMFWEDILESKLSLGPQESESLALAGLISQMIGVPLDQTD